MNVEQFHRKQEVDTYLKKEKKKRKHTDDRVATLEGTEGVKYALIVLKDIKAGGTDGGTFTSGAWQTRTLNTEEVDTKNLCTLSANQFVFEAGTYELEAYSAGYRCDGHQLRLYNVTGATTIAAGTPERSDAADASITYAKLYCRFTIAAGQSLEIQHRCQTTKASDGFGRGINFGESLVFTMVKARKIY